MKSRTRFGLLGLLGLFGIMGAVLFWTGWPNVGASPQGERLERVARSEHYDVQRARFTNALPTQNHFQLTTLWQWVVGRAHTTPDVPPVVFENTAKVLREPPKSGLRVTWFGHSSVLIELDGVRVLTDPVWGERSSPWTFLGPKRFFAPVMPLEELPPLDAVVISHDHYDHLDAPSIRRLASRVPLFLVPLGVGARLESWGVPAAKIVELDWWERYNLAGTEIVATPARHFSGRSLVDSNQTLWASWAILGAHHRAYFSGDTAMFPGFKEIGERLGPFDIAMMESGAYHQDWADVHMGPEQALLAFKDVRGQVLLPIHWGTFKLALHAWTEPVERILAGAAQAKIQVTVPRPGQSVEMTSLPELERWWPAVEWETAEEHPVVSSGLDPRER